MAKTTARNYQLVYRVIDTDPAHRVSDPRHPDHGAVYSPLVASGEETGMLTHAEARADFAETTAIWEAASAAYRVEAAVYLRDGTYRVRWGRDDLARWRAEGLV